MRKTPVIESGLGSSPGRNTVLCTYRQDTLLSPRLSLLGVKMGTGEFNAGDNLAMD